ncbi:hypothetical protein EF901_17250, partial [Staphylococcus aureus]
GWGSAEIVTMFIIGAIFIAAFVIRELTMRAPMYQRTTNPRSRLSRYRRTVRLDLVHYYTDSVKPVIKVGVQLKS